MKFLHKIQKHLSLAKIKKLHLRTIIAGNVVILALLTTAIFYFFIYPAGSPTTFASDYTYISDEQIKESARAMRLACLKEEKDKCYKEQFIPFTETYGIPAAEKAVYALQDYEPYLRNCHVISHEIAKAATRKHPDKWRELLDSTNYNVCGAGYFHGVLEAHTGDDPSFIISPEFINEICAQEPINFKARTCAHILGHLSLVDHEGDVEKTLPVCAGINPQLQLDCYNGIFMEDSFKLALAEHGFAEIPVRDEKRMKAQRERCLKYTAVQGVACWTDMAEIFAEFYNYDADKTYKSCYEAPSEPERNHCYLKAVILMAASPQYDEVDKLLSPCKFYQKDPQLYRHCISFMNSSFMNYSPKFANRGVMLCSNIPKSYREGCFKELGNLLKERVTSIPEREELCQDTPSEYMPLCATN